MASAARSSTAPHEDPVAGVPGPENPCREASKVGRWRGTPQLFAHVARVVGRAVSDDSTCSPTPAIDLEVHNDHELFNGADDFLTNVTPEGLRHFRSICIRSKGSGRVAAVTFRRTRPWWKPGEGADHEILIELSGDSAWRTEAQNTIDAALARGGSRISALGATNIGGICAGLASIVTWISVAYLLKIEDSIVAIGGGVSAFVGWACGLWGTSWAIPSLEIAPADQTNMRRILRFVGPIVVAIALAGLSKKLFG
jgi:hypothetical protein